MSLVPCVTNANPSLSLLGGGGGGGSTFETASISSLTVSTINGVPGGGAVLNTVVPIAQTWTIGDNENVTIGAVSTVAGHTYVGSVNLANFGPLTTGSYADTDTFNFFFGTTPVYAASPQQLSSLSALGSLGVGIPFITQATSSNAILQFKMSGPPGQISTSIGIGYNPATSFQAVITDLGA